MIAYIVNGGEGIRVKEITDRLGCSKSDIPISGKPFSKWQEEWLGQQDIIEVSTEWSDRGVGTGGVIKLNRVYTPYLIVYGDTYTPISIRDMYEYHVQCAADMMVAVKTVRDRDYGLWQSINTTVRDNNTGIQNLYPIAQCYDRHGTDRLNPEKEESFLTNVGIYIVGERAQDWIHNTPWVREDPTADGSRRSLSLENDVFAGSNFFKCLRVMLYDVGDLPVYDVGTPERIVQTEELVIQRGGR